MQPITREYTHGDLDWEIVAIGGHYRFTDEVRLPFEGKEIFYLKGYALFDTTCCGAGGCSYIMVQGFVAQWKTGKNAAGEPVSRVTPIQDPALQRRIQQFLIKKENVQQVQFR
ncbi:MAG: hypothetical protein C4519_06925 [Desulfobacteraceae bacterium]|nr:MAG: hypothetical protein C4519_06925 [Desulfobacteraceae bacterium]